MRGRREEADGVGLDCWEVETTLFLTKGGCGWGWEKGV